jgi:hypothetical protein
MPMRTKGILILAGIALLGTAVGVVALRDGKPARAPTPDSDSALPEMIEPDVPQARTDSPPIARPLPTAVPSSPKAVPSANPRDESTLMERLRELRSQDPELSLRLAREGDTKFPGSPDAAERGWFAVRALMEMQRVDEAVAEARGMVEKYRGTFFAADVERHMLTHPMTHPSEVGYGKAH